MGISNFLAYLWGVFLIVIPLSLITNPKQIKNIFELAKNETALFIGGIISFTIGIITVLLNNSWAYDWKIIITILGLLAVAKGCFFLFWPDKVIKFYSRMADKEWIFYILFTAVFFGLFIIYFGYMGK